ncbi:MAG: hypothetical protein LQ348_003153 [Seirophora lacunosa]|nr:MAG: hypothetical protein LQ348_003153 [Seirophora lacunosa]
MPSTPAVAMPPVIRLTSFLADSRSLSLRPQCSSAAVVVVEFHPERGNIFILAFADATCAVYDAAYIFRASNRGPRASGASVGGTGWEISHIKNLHRLGGTAMREHAHRIAQLPEPLAPDSAIGSDQGEGIIAAVFVPGHKTIVVAVGSEGRCYVVDFAASEAHKANVMCIWDTGKLLTSLSILTLSPEGGPELPIAGIRDYDTVSNTNVLAIGCEDGKVLFFDLAGSALLQQNLELSDHRIAAVEWMEGDDWPEPSPQQSALYEPSKRRSRSKQKSMGAVLAGGRRTVSEEVITINDSPPANTRARTALTRSLSDQESPLGSRADNIVDIEQRAMERHLSESQKDRPPPAKTPYPAVANHEDSSGLEDTSSSGSLGSMLRRFQFPDPPKHHESQSGRIPRTGAEQLPRNNSWAVDLQPHDPVLRERSHNALFTTRVGGMQEAMEKQPSLIVDSNIQGPLHEAVVSKLPASNVPFESDSAARNDEYDSKSGMVKAADQADEDLWTDIGPDVFTHDRLGGPHPVGKENSTSRSDSNVVGASPDDPIDTGLAGEGTMYRRPRRRREPGIPFAIHIDDVDQPDHPQPLSAHPGKFPSSGQRRPPLVPTNVNSSHAASATRTPWYRQRHRTGNSESHRSSIYGPGALARKVKQEVMVTVNIELDVLRRQMSGKFAEQSKWFEKELKSSQEWTLRVEEENRKLREEMAKERRRRVVDREGMRTLC